MAAKTKEPLKAYCFTDTLLHNTRIQNLVRRTVGLHITWNAADHCFHLPADATKAEQKRVQDLLSGFAAGCEN